MKKAKHLATIDWNFPIVPPQQTHQQRCHSNSQLGSNVEHYLA